MSETARSDDSAPSISSYPPAFASLITTFIKRAEEAEERAHKTLVILRSKDQQVLQLQQRMELLEKIASRLEEVMVPPLDLPPSPQSTDTIDALHTRDKDRTLEDNHMNRVPLETLYLRRSSTLQQGNSADVDEVHNCYTRCQHLIDGLERSNCQLREALQAESEYRAKDHEQYITTLTKISKAFKEKHANQESTGSHVTHPEHLLIKELQRQGLSNSILEEITSVFHAAGDTLVQGNGPNNEDNKQNVLRNCTHMALIDKEDLKEKVDMAGKIIIRLQKRLEQAENKSVNRDRKPKLIGIQRKKSSRSVVSSYHTPPSSLSLKVKPKARFSHNFFSALKRKNYKLKNKCQHLYEKFNESVILCGKLQEDLVNAKKLSKLKDGVKKTEVWTQTEKVTSPLTHSEVPADRPEKPQTSRSVHILHGRLDAAAKVMSKQCKQLQDLQHQLSLRDSMAESFKKRLLRAESALASKDVLEEATRRQMHDLENRNSSLSQEVQNLHDSVNQLTQELSSQKELNNKIEKQKENAVQQFEEMKKNLEVKLHSLSSTLQMKDELSNRATEDLESKLRCLNKQFVAQVTEASDRLVAADSKIQELYLGIETFLKLLFSLNRPSSTELTPSSQAAAVQVASDILEMAPGQVQTILHSSRYDHYLVNMWIKECNRLVHNKVFAKNLGHFLLDAVLEAQIS